MDSCYSMIGIAPETVASDDISIGLIDDGSGRFEYRYWLHEVKQVRSLFQIYYEGFRGGIDHITSKLVHENERIPSAIVQVRDHFGPYPLFF